MSGLLPANRTLQLSDISGNISHQGVLTSNVSGTTLLTGTFPTTSTGTSLCHALYTNSTTGGLKFLNASGTGTGGHEFWTSNSTTAPIQTASLDVSGFSIIKDTIITNYDTYSVIVSSPTFIIMNTNPSVPPYNWLLGEMYIIQVGNTTATMTTGIDYNVKYIDSQQVRVYTTSSDTSPVIDSSDITSVLLPNGSTVEINTSILSSTDLTFNSVSLPSQVSTNTSNIGTNTTNIATNTSDINLLEIKQTNLINVYNSPAMYADGAPPSAVPSTSSNTYGQFGFYFKNLTVGLKINWYMPPATGMKVSDILGLYMRYFNCSTTSNDNSPFLYVLTTPTGSGDYFPNFFKSSMVYIINTTPVANTSYTMFMNVSGSCPTPSAYASNIQTMIQSPVQPNPRGTYASTESVLAFVIGTNSTSPVNSVEFIAQKLGIMTATGTQELNYMTLL